MCKREKTIVNVTNKTTKNINNETTNCTTSLLDILARVSLFTWCFIIASVLALAGTVTALILKASVGLIVLGALTILLGAVAAFNTDRFKASGSENTNSKPCRLTKIGIIILAISLALGICSLAFGIVMCIGTEEDIIYTYDFSKLENSFTPGSDKTCTVEVLPESAGMYTLKIKGATLDGITSEKGNKIYPTQNTDGEYYSVFMIINTKYLFNLHSTDESFSIELEKTS